MLRRGMISLGLSREGRPFYGARNIVRNLQKYVCLSVPLYTILCSRRQRYKSTLNALPVFSCLMHQKFCTKCTIIIIIIT
jgi:hypothetical protein